MRDAGPVLQRFEANGLSEPEAAMLILPALGMEAGYYAPLAKALAALGLEVAVLIPRGHGDGAPPPSRRRDFGFRELLDEDIPRAMHQLGSGRSGRPLLLLGHSLGGHLAAITAGRMPGEVDGLVLAACGSPWVGAYRGSALRKLRLLCAAIPPATALLGYYPGHRLGFGGREARTLMHDWLALARSNRYRAAGMAEDLEAGIARYAGPVLSLRMADDDYAPEAAVEAVLGKFTAARLERVVLDADALQTRADHFRWVRRPDAVLSCIAGWWQAQGPAPTAAMAAAARAGGPDVTTDRARQVP